MSNSCTTPEERGKGLNYVQLSSPFRSLLSKDGSIYGTLPKAFKADVLVRSRVEDPKVLEERRALTQAKSVSELASIQGLGDFPIPATLERLMQGKVGSGEKKEKKER